MYKDQASTLTLGNFLIKKKASVHIHGKVHHVCVTEEVQFSMKQLLLIVDLRNRVGNRKHRWGGWGVGVVQYYYLTMRPWLNKAIFKHELWKMSPQWGPDFVLSLPFTCEQCNMRFSGQTHTTEMPGVRDRGTQDVTYIFCCRDHVLLFTVYPPEYRCKLICILTWAHFFTCRMAGETPENVLSNWLGHLCCHIQPHV